MSEFQKKYRIPALILIQMSSLMLAGAMLFVNLSLGLWIIYVSIAISWTNLLAGATYFVPLSRGNWHLVPKEFFGHPNTYLIYSIILFPSIQVAGYATSYHQLSLYDPTSFNEPLSVIDTLYFSLVTLTTVGYGDIAPRTELARAIVTTQLIETMVFTVTVIGAVVNIITAKSTKPE